MWQVARTIITAMVVVLQVQFSNGKAVQALSNTPEDMKSFQIEKFLGLDAQGDPAAQKVIQRFTELPTCNQMAAAALILTCRSSKSGDEELTNELLEEEKKLFAIRSTGCELSDSNDWSLIPAACKPFVPTKEVPIPGDWVDYTTVDGRQQPNLRTRKVDHTTKQDREQCIAALQESPQAWTSYSNAKQNALQSCSELRHNIQKDELSGMYKELVAIVRLLPDVQRNLTESIRQFLSGLESQGEERIRANQAQADAQISRTNAKYEEMMLDFHKRYLDMMSRMYDAAEERNRDLALAQSKNAEDLRQQTAYAIELYDQNMKQIWYNASAAVQESTMQMLGSLQQVNNQVSALGEQVALSQEATRNNTIQILQNQEQAENVSLTLENAQAAATEFLIVFKCVSTMAGTFRRAYDLAMSHPFYTFVVVISIVLGYLLGGSTILQALGSFLKHTSTLAGAVTGTSFKLAKRVCVATVGHVSEAGSLLKQSIGIKSAISVLLVVVVITRYLLAVESPYQLIRRWEVLDVSHVEIAILVMIVVFVAVFLCAAFVMRFVHGISDGQQEALVTPSRTTRGLPFNDPKTYGNKKWAV